MAKRKKNKLPDIEDSLDKLKEQEGEPVVGMVPTEEELREIEKNSVIVGAESVKELKDIKVEKITPVYDRGLVPKKIKMPPTSEIFSIKDQGSSRLVIKKDGTKLTIPK